MGHFHRGFINSGVCFYACPISERGINKRAILNKIGCKKFFELKILEGAGLLILSFFLRLSNLEGGIKKGNTIIFNIERKNKLLFYIIR
jgi:hypothetical protein